MKVKIDITALLFKITYLYVLANTVHLASTFFSRFSLRKYINSHNSFIMKFFRRFFPFQYFSVTLSKHFGCLPARPNSPVKQFSTRDELKDQTDFHGRFKYFLKFYLRETHTSRKNINNCSFPSSLKMAKIMDKAIACISSGQGQVSESPPCSH